MKCIAIYVHIKGEPELTKPPELTVVATIQYITIKMFFF